MHPYTSTLPKSLIDVCGEPFIGHQLRLLSANGITNVILCVGHLGDQIREYVGDGRRFGVEADYSFDGPMLKGTGGALKQALPLLGEDFFVLYGDSYLTCDYRAVEKSFLNSRKSALMTVFRNDGRWGNSNVDFDAGRILAYDKTHTSPRMRYIDYGLGVMSRGALTAPGTAEQKDLADIYRTLLARGELGAVEVYDRFYEIGSVNGLDDLVSYLTNRDIV